jgi:hypothetical protein
MQRPTRANWKALGYSSLKEAQAVWKRAFGKGDPLQDDPREKFREEVARQLVSKYGDRTAQADYEKAIRAPLKESPEDRARQLELEYQYGDRLQEAWQNPPKRRKKKRPEGYDAKGIPFTYGFDGERLRVGDRVALTQFRGSVGTIVRMSTTEKDRVRVQLDEWTEGNLVGGPGEAFMKVG